MPDERMVNAGLKVFFDAQVNRIFIWGGMALVAWGFYSRTQIGVNDAMAI